jgi:hypothetical protein
MKHIVTTHEDETKAKTDYAQVRPGEPVVADAAVEQTAHDLLKVLKEIDEKELEASRLRGILMNAMKHMATLKAADGTILCTWTEGNISKKVDYKGLFKLYGVKAEDIAKFTKASQGARRFSLELE